MKKRMPLMLDINTLKKGKIIIMSSINKEYIKFHTASYDNDIEKTNKSLKFSVSLKQGRGPKPKNEYLEMKRHRHLNIFFENLQIKI